MSSTHETLEERIRHALVTVAGTVTEDHVADPAPQSTPARTPRRRWRLAAGVGALLVPVGAAAAAVVHQGPEYVDTIPADRIVTSGDVDGSRYLVVESDRTNKCGDPVPGVELVEERKNLFGSEWNTTGYAYGERRWAPRCGDTVIDTSRYLKNPALFDQSGSPVGDSFVWVYSVHPSVTQVRITSGDFTEDLEVHRVDGAGYAVFEIPAGLDTFTSELVAGDHVVPGSVLERDAPTRP